VFRFFFFWHGSAWHASGCQKGAAEEPLRGCLNSKPWKHIPDPLKTGRGP